MYALKYSGDSPLAAMFCACSREYSSAYSSNLAFGVSLTDVLLGACPARVRAFP